MPSTSNVHLPAALSNLAIKMSQVPMGFVADQIAPVVPVAKQSDKYHIFSIEHLTDDTSPLRGDKDSPREVDFTLSSDTYYAKPYEFKFFVPDNAARAADAPLSLEQDGTIMMVEKIRLYIEKAIKTQFETIKTTSGQYVTGSTDFTQWNEAGADPLDDILTWKDSATLVMGREPNKILLGSNIWKDFLKADGVRDLMKMYRPQELVNGRFPPDLAGMQVVIPGAIEQTANLGDVTVPFTGISLSRAWSGDDVYLFYAANGFGTRTMTFLHQLRFVPFYARTARDEDRGGGGTNVYVGTYQAEKIVCSRACYAAVDVLS